MKKNNFFEKLWPFLILLFATIVISVPIFTMNLSKCNEFRIHIGRVLYIKETIENGVFPPLLSYKNMNCFGYALNIFYGPITTYIPIIIAYIAGSVITAIKIVTTLSVFFSGIAMYLFVKKITNNKIASLIAAVLYIAAPYKLTDIYSRNAMGEYIAFIFIPIFFNGLYEIVERNNKKKNYLVIFGAIGLILSHTITTIYAFIFALAYIVNNFEKICTKEFLKSIIIDSLIIISVSAFYIIPLLECKTFAKYSIYDNDHMNTSGRATYSQSATIANLFDNELNEEDNQGLVLSIGIISLILSLFTIFCYKKVDKKYKNFYLLSIIFSIISLFMCTRYFPWVYMIKLLTVIQFPWRMLGFYIFFDSVVCGINAMILAKNFKIVGKIFVAIMLIASIFLAGLRSFKHFEGNDLTDDKEYEEHYMTVEKVEPCYINREYLPLNASNNIRYIETRENRTYILSGKATIKSENKDNFNDTIEISGVDKASIELPYLYYPGYSVKLNGKEIKTYESDKGFIAVNIAKDGIVTVKYTGTIFEKIGYAISILGILFLIFYLNKKEKNINV